MRSREAPPIPHRAEPLEPLAFQWMAHGRRGWAKIGEGGSLPALGFAFFGALAAMGIGIFQSAAGSLALLGHGSEGLRTTVSGLTALGLSFVGVAGGATAERHPTTSTILLCVAVAGGFATIGVWWRFPAACFGIGALLSLIVRWHRRPRRA